MSNFGLRNSEPAVFHAPCLCTYSQPLKRTQGREGLYHLAASLAWESFEDIFADVKATETNVFCCFLPVQTACNPEESVLPTIAHNCCKHPQKCYEQATLW